MLAVGILLFLIGVFLVLPRKVSTLIREDPLVSQRFRGATAEYLNDPEGGKKAISEEIKRMLQSDIEIQKTVEDSVQAALSEVNMAEVVKGRVDDVLKEKPLADFVTEFLKEEEGQALLKKATQEYFASLEGRKELGNEVKRINQYPEMLAQVNASVKATLRSDDFKLLRNVIGPHLQIIQRRLREEIAQNAERSIKAVKSPLPEDKIFDKRSYRELEDIIKGIKSRPQSPDESFALRILFLVKALWP